MYIFRKGGVRSLKNAKETVSRTMVTILYVSLWKGFDIRSLKKLQESNIQSFYF